MTDEKTMTREGRIKDTDLGECVRVKLRSWVGPLYAGDKGKEMWEEYVFPRNQWIHAFHPRHPSAINLVSKQLTACVSPSCSYYQELCKYGNFRWTKPVEQSDAL